MASMFSNLRERLGLGRRDNAAEQEKAPESAFEATSRQWLACEDEKQRAAIWERLCKTLPNTLFLAPMCYEGEDPNAAVKDRELHATAGTKRLFEAREAVVMKGNPGYRLAKKSDKRRVHLRSIVYRKTQEEWVPLFTDFTKLLPVFGKASRVTLISFEEAKKIAEPYSGLVINPGEEAIKLESGELSRIR